MMKKITLLMALLFISASTFGQMYYLPPTPGNPGNLNNDNEYPNGSGLDASWTLLQGPSGTPTWSANQTVPFPFTFNGASATTYKVSTTGILTFSTSASTVPASTPAVLPSASIPDNSICVWGIAATGSNDNVMMKTFGTAPNRQHWVFFTSHTNPGTGGGWTYWSIVLEETSNNVYIVDQRHSGPPTVSLGIQFSSTSAVSVAGSPAIAAMAGSNETPSDNMHYTFVNGVQPAYDMSALSVEMPNYLILNQAPFDVSGKLMNLGTTTITDLDFNYSINGAAAVTTNFTGLSSGTFDTDSLSTGPSWTPAAVGTYTVKIWASNLNSGNADMNNSNDTITKIVNVVDNFVVRRPLYETFTSSTCPPCVPANTNMEALFNTNSNIGEQSSIKYQMSWPGSGDPYYTDEGGDRRVYYSVNSVPNVAIDGGWNGNGNGLTQGIMDQYKSVPAFVDLEAKHTISGQKVDVQIDATFLNAFSSSSNTLHVAIVENITYQNVGSNGETEFHHVMKKMLPDANGTAIGAQPQGMKSWTMSYTFNGSYRLSNSAGDPINHATEHSIEDFNNIGVIAWIQDASTKEVFQSSSNMQSIGINENLGTVDFNIFPNPANDFVNIRFNENTENVNIELTNALGQVVYAEVIDNTYSGESTELNTSNLMPGIYFVKIASEGKLSTQKLIIE